MIVDTHCHLNIPNTQFYYYNDHSVFSLIDGMNESGISKSIVCLNPKISDFSCPNDCTKQCQIYGINHNFERCKAVNCPFEDIHPVTVEDSQNSSLILKCQKCGTIVYKGPDPLRQYNLQLLKIVEKYPGKLYPMIYLHLSNSTLKSEIEFFESNFKIVGYKFHPRTNYRSFDEIQEIPTKLPIMVHTGLKPYDYAKPVINFSKRHNGKIVLAHGCRLDVECLTEVANSDNLYIDLCPAIPLFKKKGHAIASSFPHEINRPSDIFMHTLKYVPADKILFGTDYPWGFQQEECSLLNELPISIDEKEKIMYKNAQRIYSID